ncbi:MAG: Asp23/Gls24 family envelope stress response protein [Oscillospiraceae bacterium]|nr:Asp23/Gls24 family envelope stress response protein [Oscillospiraceae bacterium]
MITWENHIGKITISNRYLTDLITGTVSSCVGVADMKSVSLISDICSFIKKDSMAGKGVNVRVKDNRLVIDVHVSVTFGTNISAVTASLKHKVRYAVEEATGAEVDSVNIFVDSITE